MILRTPTFRLILFSVVIIVMALTTQQCSRSRQPRIVLWAWERPENLEFINPNEISVAFLAKTIQLRAEETIVKPRLQPLKFATGTELIAVARIETERAALSRAQLDKTVSAIALLAQQTKIRSIQIDFDARESERQFYRDMLQSLRQQLPAEIQLSITALASWCIHDDWVSGLPINEAIPMLFRLGVERDEVRSYLTSGKAFRSRLCQNSLGVSTDESFPDMPATKADRIYVFNPQPWSAASVNKVLKEWRQ